MKPNDPMPALAQPRHPGFEQMRHSLSRFRAELDDLEEDHARIRHNVEAQRDENAKLRAALKRIAEGYPSTDGAREIAQDALK